MRCPKPISRLPLASASRIQASARSGLPISSIIDSAGPGAPPWSGPFSAPSAPVTAETISEAVEAITRAVKVEAFIPWSATVTR